MSLNLVDALTGSSFYKNWKAKAEASAAADRAAQHAAYCAEAVTITTDLAGARTRIDPLRQKAAAELEKKDAAAAVARAALLAIDRDLWNRKARDTSRLNQLDGLRIGSADPRIDEAKQRLNNRVDVMRREGPTELQVRVTDLDSRTGVRYERRSNAGAVSRVIQAVTAARYQLDALKLMEVDDVAAAIAAIEASVPFSDIKQVVVDGPAAA
jgi:hypothetical protein